MSHTTAIPVGSGRVFTLDSVVSTRRAKPPAVGFSEGHTCHLACVVSGDAVADDRGLHTSSCPWRSSRALNIAGLRSRGESRPSLPASAV